MLGTKNNPKIAFRLVMLFLRTVGFCEKTQRSLSLRRCLLLCFEAFKEVTMNVVQ